MGIVMKEADSKDGSEQEKIAGAIRIDEGQVRSHVEQVVRESPRAIACSNG